MIIDNNIISLLYFNKKLNIDECGNIWEIYNKNLCVYDQSCYKFSTGSCKILGYSYLSTKDINTKKLFENDFTVDFWININKWVIEGGIFSCAINKNSGFSIITNKKKKTLELRFNSNNQMINFISDKELQLNKWYHIAFSKENNTLYYFINGTLKKAFLNINIIGLSDTIILGNYHHANPNSDNFKGNIDEFRIRNECVYKDKSLKIPNSTYIRTQTYKFSLLYINNPNNILKDVNFFIGKQYNNTFNTKRTVIQQIKLKTNNIRDILLGDLREYGYMNITINTHTSRKISRDIKIKHLTFNNLIAQMKTMNDTVTDTMQSYKYDTKRKVKKDKKPPVMCCFVFNLNYFLIGMRNQNI